MSLSLIKSMGRIDLEVKRDANKEARVKGRRVADVWDTFCIVASVQPMSADEIRQEVGASAERNSDGIKVYSFEEIKTVDVAAQKKADRVVYLGEEFEAVRVFKHLDNRMRLVHYKSICQKVNRVRVR